MCACLSLSIGGMGKGGSGGARSWTGSLLSSAADFGPGPEGAAAARPGSLPTTPLAADFGPGPEGAAAGRSAGRGVCPRRRLWVEGRSAGQGVCFLRLSPPTSDLARLRRRGMQLDGKFSLYASRRRLRGWSGGGGGEVLCLCVEFAFLSFTHWPLLCSLTGPKTPNTI